MSLSRSRSAQNGWVPFCPPLKTHPKTNPAVLGLEDKLGAKGIRKGLEKRRKMAFPQYIGPGLKMAFGPLGSNSLKGGSGRAFLAVDLFLLRIPTSPPTRLLPGRLGLLCGKQGKGGAWDLGWWVGGLVGWWVGGLVGWWVGGLVGWWVGGLVGWWVGGLVGWWVGGLVLSRE